MKAIESLGSFGLAFHHHAGRQVAKDNAGGGFVHVLTSVPLRAYELLLNVLLVDSQALQALEKVAFLFRRNGETAQVHTPPSYRAQRNPML